jgi:hypothetical protein
MGGGGSAIRWLLRSGDLVTWPLRLQAAELGDADTADLFTEISRAMDKQLWFVEAHLQAEH